jgi:CBS domain-containing protein
MTTSVLSVTLNTPARDAVQLMREKRIHHLLVKDGSARIGIVSDRNLGGRQAPRATLERTVGDVMTAHVVSVDANATPLLDLLGRGAARPLSEARRRNLHHRTPHRKKLDRTAFGNGTRPM